MISLGMGDFARTTKPPIATKAPGEDPEAKHAKAERERKFQARLSHVIAHENAHAAAGGSLAGAPVIHADKATGQVSGHVPIKMDFGKTADDALRNAQIISGAALAPGDPSPQDLAVSATALSKGASLAASRRENEKKQKSAQKANPFAFQTVKSTAKNPFSGSVNA